MRRFMTVTRVSVFYLSALLLAAGYPLMAMADTPDTATTTATAAPATTTPAIMSSTHDIPPAPTSVVVSDPVPPATPTDPAATTITSSVDATNQVKADATSGSAAVVSNTTAGSATSGDASASATVLNNVNSVITTGDNRKVTNFTYNVTGDVNGDIMLYPMLLKTMLDSPATAAPNTIVATQHNTLTNTIDLSAQSGNASVSGNTTAGSATTGSAHTVANVVNVLNSMISAHQSFVGTVNIYGNLHGDILIAPDFIPQVIASNSQLQSAPTDTTTAGASSDTQAIVNNIALTAKSGNASVLHNTTAGNAISGSSNTNVVIFNLSGHAVVAKDSLLVFVNVLGTWIGVIVDAPTGATSALIGNGVVSDTSTPPDQQVAVHSTASITNTLTLGAQSGDATIQDNTLAGNATTGNATASANVANITGSQLGLSHWFGILFINVFHSWYGSFGINTSDGDPPIAAGGTPSMPAAIAFVPSTHAGASSFHPTSYIGFTNNFAGNRGQLASTAAPGDGAVLAATDGAPATTSAQTALNPTSHAAVGSDYRWPIIIGSMLIIGAALAGFRWILARR